MHSVFKPMLQCGMGNSACEHGLRLCECESIIIYNIHKSKIESVFYSGTMDDNMGNDE